MLADGTYDAFVIDATVVDAVTTLELTILAGAQKGDVVAVQTTGLRRDEVDLLGLPATLTIENGVPSVAIED